MIPRLVYSLLSLCSLAATTTSATTTDSSYYFHYSDDNSDHRSLSDWDCTDATSPDYVGDGYCDGDNNVDPCYDGGDCCESTCVSWACGDFGYDCVDPSYSTGDGPFGGVGVGSYSYYSYSSYSYGYDEYSNGNENPTGDDDCSCSTDDSAAPTATICILRNTTVCWGNLHSYVDRTGTGPFDGTDGGFDVLRTPAFGDLDGDGDLDLVVGELDGVLNYYENVGNAASPSYEARTGNENPFDGIDVGSDSKPAFADLDGDGDLDLVVGEVYGFLYYYENVGSAASPSYAAVTGSASPFDGIDVDFRSAPTFGDLDGDGDLDLVVGAGDGALYYENVGSAASPTYAAVTGAANPFDGIVVSLYSAPAFGDLDGDLDLDLVVGERFGALFYYENVGSVTSPTYEAVTGSANPFDGIDVGYFSAPALVDLDGDGDLDLVVGEDNGVLHYYEIVGSAASPSYSDALGQTSCKLAEPGTFVPVEGASAATPCPVGTFSGAAASSCTPCPLGYYTNLTKQSACQLCLAPTYTLEEGKTYCDACREAYYWNSRMYVKHAEETAPDEDGQLRPCEKCCVECDDACEGGVETCANCPQGARTTLETMDLKKNFWRASIDATSIYECTLEESCKGGANSSCARGHKGPLCGACEAHYFYDTAANRCVDCGNKIEARGDNIIGTVLAVLFVVAAIGVVMRKFGLFTVLGHGVDAIREVVQGEAVEDIAKAKLEEHYEDDEDGEAAGSDTQSADDEESSGRSTEQNVMTKVKIVIATYQIACSIPWSLPQVRFPAIFEEALKLGSVVNLSFISFAKAECFGDFDYFDKLLFVTLLPVVFVLLIAVGFGLRYACVDRSRRDEILSGASYWILFTLYVLVPSTSAYCLRYFACAKYDGGYGEGVNVLRIDPTISCDSPSHDAWLPYVLFSIVAYPVGVPLGFACLLWRLRRRLDPDVDHQTVRTPSGRTIGEAGADAANQEDEHFLHEALERHAESMVQFQKLEARANDPTLEQCRFHT